MLLIVLEGLLPDLVIDVIAELPTLSKAKLGEKWKQVFNASPPAKLRRNLLLPILAYKIQEQRSGSLGSATRVRLRHLARSLENDSDSTLRFVLAIKPGTRLVRKWRDQVHLVSVETKGYQGTRYQSLSEIARLIAGTRWSGPLFFGLKAKQQNSKIKESK
jgi:hypothetical protein